ncbi:MAG TPA: (2Fe-2S)-binding protein [Acetobacteraceae bacterium]|nr:(2Fe-2S)-binding protein [Acetobacteraceae bacterium]
MFRRLEEDGLLLIFNFEGERVAARLGETVAAALLAAGIGRFRETPVSGSSRAPYCLMGVCFDCLVEIDGIANRQACMVPVADGMRVRRQRGARGVT